MISLLCLQGGLQVPDLLLEAVLLSLLCGDGRRMGSLDLLHICGVVALLMGHLLLVCGVDLLDELLMGGL